MPVVGKSSRLQLTVNFFRILIIIMILAFIALPVLWIISTSLARRISMFKLPPRLFTAFIIDNFKYVFTRMSINRWILNSLVISVGTMVLSLIIEFPQGMLFPESILEARRSC